MEFTLLGAALLAVAGVYGVLWYEAGRTNAADCTRDLWDMAIGAGLAGVAIGRIVAMVRGGTNPITHPGDILIVRSGVDTIAAAVAALAAFGWLARRDLWRNADGLAPAAVAGLALWHTGCTLRDACLGTPSDLPWAIAQTSGGVTRHPVELYAALLLAVAALALVIWKRRWPPSGVVAAAAVVATAVARGVTEPLRPVIGDGLVVWYLGAATVGAAAMIWRWRVASDRTA